MQDTNWSEKLRLAEVGGCGAAGAGAGGCGAAAAGGPADVWRVADPAGAALPRRA